MGGVEQMTHASTQHLRAMRGLGSFFSATLARSANISSHYVQWHARTWTATSLYVLPRLASRRHFKRLG